MVFSSEYYTVTFAGEGKTISEHNEDTQWRPVYMSEPAFLLDPSPEFCREFIVDSPRFERRLKRVQWKRIAPARAALIGELARESKLSGRFACRVTPIADPITWIGSHLPGQGCP